MQLLARYSRHRATSEASWFSGVVVVVVVILFLLLLLPLLLLFLLILLFFLLLLLLFLLLLLLHALLYRKYHRPMMFYFIIIIIIVVVIRYELGLDRPVSASSNNLLRSLPSLRPFDPCFSIIFGILLLFILVTCQQEPI